ncbi:MAG TPA: hypothetical protein VLI94_05590 [Solirubrobacterales bacterium]|nr:hypothetical protein [Solirubrobacterales bacterium]
MAFQEITNVPIKHIDTVIDVVSKGDGTHDHDEVAVTSSLELVAPIDDAEEALLILPMSGEAQQKPIVRYSDEHVKEGAVFTFDPVDRSVYDEELVERLEELADGTSKKEQKSVATQLERCADGLSAAVLRVKPGETKLRVFYEIAATKVEERTFEFGVIGPLPSFVIQAGGSIGLLGILPRATSLISAIALSDPTNPGSEINTKAEADLGGRHLVGWTWQNDPLFKVRYRY